MLKLDFLSLSQYCASKVEPKTTLCFKDQMFVVASGGGQPKDMVKLYSKYSKTLFINLEGVSGITAVQPKGTHALKKTGAFKMDKFPVTEVLVPINIKSGLIFKTGTFMVLYVDPADSDKLLELLQREIVNPDVSDFPEILQKEDIRLYSFIYNVV